ncbi:flagellar basal-body rod protein FlgF [Pseudomonas aeruginosa]|uniref:flagellar basal-body rod protein FlgF n=1 Tax=Pseudomonas aeruginosa TaxID=287 RepID=UPI000FF6D370|nr:flagellar basal-body rod protein FlgF [Pseudomonas aeruginosa]MDI3619112.1 flagellar basal-body rod protein FlgF [Pseudomonas aeruginosa]QGQ05110.1 flagellar basal-body rod protein FlgF [Pseudomonas aeruginosa]RPP99995.1 flagellar basal-body rod protein FlgF [Pseudomonas aeruginosa]RPQ09311.1 flagellar basal-body rod protein FlgF [Pseudomonas aeruginosa]
MDKMLYVSMSGASQNTLAMRAHANNLANISTSGFRRDFEQARSMQVFGDSFPARVFAMSERPGTDFSHGSLQETGNELDIAIDGDGFVAVQAPDGSEAYVRTAGMHIDALGMLRTGDGLPVLGNGGPIAVPPEEKVEIGQDGTISIRALGENPNVVAVVDRIKLVNPNLKQMEKGTDGLLHYKPQPGEQAPLADANVKVVSGFLESSNVNAVEEMTAILSLSRQFELHVKIMRTAEDDSAAMARVLQIS